MKHIAAALTATLLATPALAGGPVVVAAEPEIVAPEPVYVAPAADWTGFYAGASLGYGDVSVTDDDGDGSYGGLQAGYRWDMGNTVLGAEIDWSKTDIDLATAGDNLDSIARLKLSAGYDMGRTLVYATAGGAHAKATLGGADLSENGWFLGAGLDYAVTDNWTVGGELIGHKFDDFGGTATDVDATTAALRVNFNF